jgi:hypothetical protein
VTTQVSRKKAQQSQKIVASGFIADDLSPPVNEGDKFDLSRYYF